ncbi:MAG: RagB/SusD family nutrient uptake outer membrane protein [Muribaculaceae bacterium]|nr:RagB/SusD family nutrient uptake outer membrane protein [Muribaculaceae bacterium]
MKKIYLLSSIALAGFMTSCYDLATEPMSDVITEEQRTEIIDKDPAKIDALTSGIYSNYNGWEMCYGDMFDFGYPSVMLQLDCRTADFFSIDIDLYGWFSGPAEYLDNTATSAYNIVRWRLPYNIIFTSNQVLNFIEADTDDPSYKFYRGQAYGNRAFAYWMLAQLYQFNYVGHQNDPCVPLITEENEAQVAEDGAPRATVQEIYDQILSDLNNGIELMTNNSSAVRSDKRYIDLNVLYGLRARTYLCMQEYAKAAEDAQRVINSGSFAALSATEARLPGFIDITASNWVWGIYTNTEDVHGLYTLAGFMGSYTYGYASVGMWKAISSELFSQISPNDPRRWWWIDPTTGASNAQFYTAADGDASAYLADAGAPPYAVTKFAPYNNVLGQSNNEADIPLMRIEEMYLILAEAQGMGGNLAEGKATLENFVNSYRWLDKKNPWASTSTDAASFLTEVLFQRRVELWGEGMNYYDIMRLNLDMNRMASSNWTDPSYRMQDYAYYIPAGEPIFLSQIPYTEIDYNKQLSDKDQNPTGNPSSYK